MARKILFTVLVVCFAQLAFTRYARDAPTTASPVADIFNMFNETFEAFHQSVLSVAGVKSDAEFWGKVQGDFKTFENSVKSGLDNLYEETKPLQGQTKDLVNAFNAKVSQVYEEVKAKNPEFFSGDSKKLKEFSEKTVSTIATEAKKLQDKLAKEGQTLSPKVEAAVKQVYEAAVKTANEFKVQAESAVNSIAKKN